MNRLVKPLLLLFFLSSSFAAHCQELSETARANIIKAIELMDGGKVDESIKLLKATEKLAPKMHIVPYEIGFAYNLKKDYPKAISYFTQATKCEDANDQCFSMLGNMYSISGNTKKALESYDLGLKKFPSSGRLYLERGNVFLQKDQPAEAMVHYEKGIDLDPSFASNYLRAAMLYLNSHEEVWGMIYGEIFMNLERGSERTSKMSSMLYKTYREEIVIKNDTSSSVSFSRDMGTDGDYDGDEIVALPYGTGVYEYIMLLSVVGEKKVDMASLNRIRTRFLNNYYSQKKDQSHPNALFAYQKKVADAGHLDAYNYWILSSGNNESFEDWRDNNREKWDNFIAWFKENQMKLDGTNKFSRFQY